MKIRPVGAQLFQADGQTGMTKLTVAFRIFAQAPKTNEDGAFFAESQLYTPSVLNQKYPALCTTKGSSKSNFPNCCKLCNLVEGQKTIAPLPAPLEVSRFHALQNPD
jgi:hypothetical protein